MKTISGSDVVIHQKTARLLLIVSFAIVVMAGAGCGSKGDLYFPEPSQSTGE